MSKITVHIPMTMNVIVAVAYLGAGEIDPRSQVASIALASAMIDPKDTAVAHRTCGALFAIHVYNAGPAQHAPQTEKKRDL